MPARRCDGAGTGFRQDDALGGGRRLSRRTTDVVRRTASCRRIDRHRPGGPWRRRPSADRSAPCASRAKSRGTEHPSISGGASRVSRSMVWNAISAGCSDRAGPRSNRRVPADCSRPPVLATNQDAGHRRSTTSRPGEAGVRPASSTALAIRDSTPLVAASNVGRAVQPAFRTGFRRRWGVRS